MTPRAAAGRVLHHALARPPRLGHARLVCIDGPSGAGKSVLAEAIGAGVPSAQVVHVDDLLPGWHALPVLPAILDRVLRPVIAGRDAWWREWDWTTSRRAGWHRLRPAGLIVLEGVGAGAHGWAAATSTLVWVDAPRAQRLARGVRRSDGMSEHGRRWRAAEAALFAREHTRARADLVICTRT